jgi:hypothetical protein
MRQFKDVISLGRLTTPVIILVIALFLVSSASAATITVVNTNDSGPGSLRQALADASNGDTIDFNLAGCPCTILLTTNGLSTDKNLTIVGPGAHMLTIDGNEGNLPPQSQRTIFVNSGSVSLSGITFTKAGDIGAGAILNRDGATLSLDRVVVRENILNFGFGSFGGVLNQGGHLRSEFDHQQQSRQRRRQLWNHEDHQHDHLSESVDQRWRRVQLQRIDRDHQLDDRGQCPRFLRTKHVGWRRIHFPRRDRHDEQHHRRGKSRP